MTLCHEVSSLFEKPSSYKEASYPKSIITACILLLMCVVHGCRSISKISNACARSDGGRVPETSGSQCLYLNSYISENICNLRVDKQRRREQELRKYHLKFCSDYPLYQVISKHNISNEIENMGCLDYLKRIISLDLEVENMYDEFREIMVKFDCSRTKYSVKWRCEDCEVSHFQMLFNNCVFFSVYI